MKTLKQIFLPISLLLLGVVAVIRYFLVPKKVGTKFPDVAKKKAEADVAETKLQLEKLEEKTYTDEEIEKKFN
jgi:DNA-binding transcriptional regulator GbsR (MarR family)